MERYSCGKWSRAQGSEEVAQGIKQYLEAGSKTKSSKLTLDASVNFKACDGDTGEPRTATSFVTCGSGMERPARL